MELLDAINACFEGSAAVLVWLNVAVLWRQRRVAGVHWLPIVLFAVWGYWNVFYYTALSQPLSAFAAAGVALANTAWLLLWMDCIIKGRSL